MKFNKSLLTCGLLGLITLSSCKKFLDENPDNRTDINTIAKVAQLTGTAYPSSDYLTIAETSSDNAEDKGPGVGDVDDVLSNYYTWQDKPGGGTNTADNYWNGCYEAIASANQALESIELNNFGAAVLPYKGEALVARAYAHHMLAIFFAKPYVKGGDNSSPGIPYVTKPETVLLAKYDRGTVQSTYDNIEKDLTEGMKLLSGSAYSVPKYHFTPAAAHAFAARFYLFKGEYQKVIDQVNLMIPSGDIVNYLRPVASTFKAMSLADFNLAFSKTDVKATLLQCSDYSTYQRYYTPRYGYGAKLVTMYSAANVTGKNVQNKIISYGAPNYTTYKWKEYFFYATASTGYPYLPFILFTVDEALLNRAEAYAELGSTDLALADLNTFYSVRLTGYNAATDGVTQAKIQAFYSITDPKAGAIRSILDAKKAEFLQEGIRWMDLMRRGLPVTKNLYSPTGVESTITLPATDPRRLFQLPVQVTLAGVAPNPR
jgi:hypothetical protein